MPQTKKEHLVIGISSRALFDLEEGSRIYEEKGLQEYQSYQIEREKEVLRPGIGFSLVKALLNINTLLEGERRTEVIVMSRNIANLSLRIFNSIQYYGLDISRAALIGGADLTPYLYAFNTDVFLSANDQDLLQAAFANIAAGKICVPKSEPGAEMKSIKLSFDINSIKFSNEAELLFKNYGMPAFLEYEKENIQKSVPEGPHTKMFKTISMLQRDFSAQEMPIRIALISSFASPELQRAIYSLRAWKLRLDEAFFIGNSEKEDVLKAFGANISFE